ncbi:hypothetical protein WME94_25865 [Sorangium sp. So ce429]
MSPKNDPTGRAVRRLALVNQQTVFDLLFLARRSAETAGGGATPARMPDEAPG